MMLESCRYCGCSIQNKCREDCWFVLPDVCNTCYCKRLDARDKKGLKKIKQQRTRGHNSRGG